MHSVWCTQILLNLYDIHLFYIQVVLFTFSNRDWQKAAEAAFSEKDVGSLNEILLRQGRNPELADLVKQMKARLGATWRFVHCMYYYSLAECMCIIFDITVLLFFNYMYWKK